MHGRSRLLYYGWRRYEIRETFCWLVALTMMRLYQYHIKKLSKNFGNSAMKITTSICLVSTGKLMTIDLKSRFDTGAHAHDCVSNGYNAALRRWLELMKYRSNTRTYIYAFDSLELSPTLSWPLVQYSRQLYALSHTPRTQITIYYLHRLMPEITHRCHQYVKTFCNARTIF